MQLLPALDADGVRVVVRDTVRATHESGRGDVGGEVTAVDGVLITVCLKWEKGALIPRERWVPVVTQAREWRVQR